jgi:hypothetical protein
VPEPTPSRVPGLSIRPNATWLTGVLRADQIRHDTLVSLVADLEQRRGPRGHPPPARRARRRGAAPRVRASSITSSPQSRTRRPWTTRRPGIDLHTALRLRTELDAVITKLARFNPAATARPVLLAKVSEQPERGAAA